MADRGARAAAAPCNNCPTRGCRRASCVCECQQLVDGGPVAPRAGDTELALGQLLLERPLERRRLETALEDDVATLQKRPRLAVPFRGEELTKCRHPDAAIAEIDPPEQRDLRRHRLVLASGSIPG